jgi:putative hydrolase of the HAD superfamily
MSNTTTSVTTIFFDIGGVLGTNGWGHESRIKAAKHFELDYEALEHAHSKLSNDLDTSSITLAQYLDQIVFFKPRSFSQDDFVAFMKNESQPYEDSLTLVAKLAATGSYFLATINNESKELNDYRIAKFGLSKYFSAFFSSGYLKIRKPEKEIYQMALSVCQKQAAECLFIDDREENLEWPKRLGMKTIRFENALKLEQDLKLYKI